VKCANNWQHLYAIKYTTLLFTLLLNDNASIRRTLQCKKTQCFTQ